MIVSKTSLLLAGILLLSACAKRSHVSLAANDQQPVAPLVSNQKSRININGASAKDLEELPGIGRGLAERIVQHREKYGPFRRVEHLIVVRGISDRRFRALQDFITVE
jgi:competence protein ComEA